MLGPGHQPPFGPYPPPPRPRTDGKAVLAFVLGLLSLTCGGAVTGLPAITLGAMARRDIDRSHGRLTGRALAAGGIMSGLFGTGFGFVVLLWLMGAAFAPMPDNPRVTASAPSAAAPSLASNADPDPDPDPPPSIKSPALVAGTRAYGTLEVVDVDPSRALQKQLAEIVVKAHGRPVVLHTFTRTSSACAAINASFPDSRMQRALANVTLVRVDVEDYERELASMKVETKTAPWFYKVDAKTARPTTGDAISADAWDANIPENMAPALGKFVHRATPRHRK